jgi:hypothetical protein
LSLPLSPSRVSPSLSFSFSHAHTHSLSLTHTHTHPLRQPAPLLPRQVSPRPFVLSSSFDLLSEACIQGRLDGCLVLRLPLRALPIETEVESAPSQSRSGTSVNLSNDRNPLAVCWDPLSSEYGTHKAIKTRFWRCLSGKSRFLESRFLLRSEVESARTHLTERIYRLVLQNQLPYKIVSLLFTITN